NRSLMFDVGATKSATRTVIGFQKLSLRSVTSIGVHVEPPSFEIDATQVSSLTGPDAFEYQRQYETVGSTSLVRSNVGVTNVVDPPSTSSSPTGAPGAALPVTKHVTPGAGVWSSSG